jgi:hypothetical protein
MHLVLSELFYHRSDQTNSGNNMFESLIKSMLPADFSIEENIEKFNQLVSAARGVAETVFRIEQKLDSEIVTLRDRVARLEAPDAIVVPLEGERNDHGSFDH